MYNGQCIGILAYIISIIMICAFMLLCGHFLGGKSYRRSQDIPFESGITSTGNARIRFPIKFYLIAMVFVIFDIEGIYVYIWSISIRESGWLGFIEILIFIFILLVSLIYLIRVKSFVWIKTLMQDNDNKLVGKNHNLLENTVFKEDK